MALEDLLRGQQIYQQAQLFPYQLGRSQFEFSQARSMAPYQLGQARTGLEQSQFNLRQQQAMLPYELGQARAGLEQAGFNLYRSRELFPFEKQQAELGVKRSGLGIQEAELGLQRGRSEFGEYQAGAGLRGMQRQLGEAETSIGLARIGNVKEAGQRAYTMGREAEELERLRMAGEARRTQSQMSFLPQMEALRGGIASRMAGSLGVSLPSTSQPYQSGTGYTPSWMQNYQSPSFPRY